MRYRSCRHGDTALPLYPCQIDYLKACGRAKRPKPYQPGAPSNAKGWNNSLCRLSELIKRGVYLVPNLVDFTNAFDANMLG
jgi:hypothetical protein